MENSIVWTFCGMKLERVALKHYVAWEGGWNVETLAWKAGGWVGGGGMWPVKGVGDEMWPGRGLGGETLARRRGLWWNMARRRGLWWNMARRRGLWWNIGQKKGFVVKHWPEEGVCGETLARRRGLWWNIGEKGGGGGETLWPEKRDRGETLCDVKRRCK